MKLILSCLLIISLGITGGYYYRNNTQQQLSPEIRIGLNSWPGYEFFYLAEQQGFYKDLGLNIEIVEYGSLEDVRHGFEKGQIDIMNSTIIELLLSDERSNRRPKAFFISDFSNGGDVILGNSKIQSIKQLRDKKVAVEPNSLGLFMLTRALQKHNLKLDDVHMIGLDQLSMEDAIMRNEVDAIVSYPPTSINVLRNLEGAKTIFTSAEIPGEIIDVASASEKFIKQRSDDIKKILQAWDMAVEFHNNNPEQANKIMAERQHITPEEFAAVLGDLMVLTTKEQPPYFTEGGVIESAIEHAADVFHDTKLIDKRIKGNSMVYPILMEK